MQERNMQFQFHASGLAVNVVFRCKQHYFEHIIGKSLMVLGQVILVDITHSPLSNTTYESTYVSQTVNLLPPFSFRKLLSFNEVRQY
jgi:hypothetical protein